MQPAQRGWSGGLDYRKETVYDTGPIIMRHLTEIPCRHVRLIAVEPYMLNTVINESLIGFAEIELFSQGRNVAIGKAFHADFKPGPMRSLTALTDGRNLYGRILPVRTWMNELARRHDLESERPIVMAELNRRYARQKQNLTRMKWLAVLLGAGIVFTLLIDRILRMREVARITERFAADLHDELGANLHTIGLLSDLAEQAREEPQELSMLHQRIRAVTERTRTAMQHCTAMQEASGLYAGLKTDMQRAAQRIMAKLEHDITIEGEEYLEQLGPRTRVDLFLFYKECLVNISRHSEATEFSTRLKAGPREIRLTVRDNGHGLGESKGNGMPASHPCVGCQRPPLSAQASMRSAKHGHLIVSTAWDSDSSVVRIMGICLRLLALFRPQSRKAMGRRFCGQRSFPGQHLSYQLLYDIGIGPRHVVRLRPAGFNVIQFRAVEILADHHFPFAVLSRWGVLQNVPPCMPGSP